ncbi:GGDEF domain-containing protein [Dasania marina]|uniref:GGDEF domain-containing protein n=1 Tax=Dasania marina TaxID=471499 RepID=UPI00037884D0|nr:GGDEF domain-containing protein [Dasania marina]
MNKITLRAIQGGILAAGAPVGWLIIRCLSGADLLTELQQHSGLYAYMLFGTQAVFISFSLYVGKQEQLISNLAIRDSLTGIFNLRFMVERMNEEIANAQRYQTPLSVIYLDLDHFKKVNDQYGHPGGDEVLRKVTQAISLKTRAQDVFARVGGEEFAILLPQCSYTDAKDYAERIRLTIEQLSIEIPPHRSFGVTISLGVATLQEQESVNAFYQRADQNLYLAKQQGRNKAVA